MSIANTELSNQKLSGPIRKYGDIMRASGTWPAKRAEGEYPAYAPDKQHCRAGCICGIILAEVLQDIVFLDKKYQFAYS